MQNVLTITRASREIADGSTSRVVGCPLAGCDHALDIVSLIRAAYVNVLDRATKRISLTFKIYRQFSTVAAAIHHTMLEAQNHTGRADFALTLDDGATVHTWTIPGAGWPRIVPEMCAGVGVMMTYEVTGGRVVYTATGAAPLPMAYELLGEGGVAILGEGGQVIEPEH